MRDKTIKLITSFLMLLFLIAIFSFSTNDTKKNENFQMTTKENKPNTSQFWDLTGSPISIDDSDPSKNWSYTASHYDWCSGSGSWIDPYIIENVTIDGQGLGNCIEIRNSNAYFVIRNCIVYNSYAYSDNAGINLYHVDNGKIINNNCSDSTLIGLGIYSYYSDNNTISGINASNYICGIHLHYSNNNALSGINSSIYIEDSNNNTISGINTSDGVGILLRDSNNNTLSENYATNNIEYGIHLDRSDNNVLSVNTASNNKYHGIYLYDSNNNRLSGNNASNNNDHGIILALSDNNRLSGNTVINNKYHGVYLNRGDNNTLSGNLMNYCGIYLSGSFAELASHSIDNTNLVNNKPVYYYVNEHGLGSSNFTDAGQIILINCNNSIISGFNLSNGTTGIYLGYSNNNKISGNIANNNSHFGYGIYLDHSDNNTISENIINNNTYGIDLDYSNNNTISENTINNNYYGINLSHSNNNTISGNMMSNNEDGLYLSSSKFNQISGNTANNNSHYGIHLSSSNNTLTGNTANYNNQDGIYLAGSSNNTLLRNTVSNNNDDGINLYYSYNNTISESTIINNSYGIVLDYSDHNTLSGNTIRDNKHYGTYITGGMSSTQNLLFNNSYLTNNVHAFDDGINNQWNNSVMGNYWDNYTGIDTDHNGIGDSPFSFHGGTDYLPIINIAPSIIINSPTIFEVFRETAPNFNVEISDPILDTMWYTIDNGVTKTIFTLNGTINQALWEVFPEGIVIIKFYANDTFGRIGFAEVSITKDVSVPIITINNPQNNDLIGTIAPSFDISIEEPNLDKMWYTVDGGITNTTFTTNGTINQELWNIVSNGTTTITFYANDSAGNEAFNSVLVRVDKIIPSIIIHSPIENQLFGTKYRSPMFNISVDDIFHDKKWYTLNQDTTKYFFITAWDYINEAAWYSLPEDSVKMRFYTNDSAGNIGFAEVTIRKDISAPIISILNPQINDIIGTTAPNFDISLDELNLDNVWYSLNGGINITFTGLTGTINQALWEIFPEGNVVIKFYANDTLGRIGFAVISITKDVTAPIIAINNPHNNDLIGATAPSFNIFIDEPNLDTVWYSLNGGANLIYEYNFYGGTGTVNQVIWDALPEGNITLRFYANDSVGNLNFQEVTVVKEITQPSPPGIPGYDLLFLLGIISTLTIIIIRKRLNHLD